MIQIITDQQAPQGVLVEWALKRMHDEDIRGMEDLGPHTAHAVVRIHPDGRMEPMCVVIWNWFRQMQFGNDIRVIIASDNPRWCLPGVLRVLFSYPYEQLGCERITAVIRDGNKRSLKLCQGLGFVREGMLRRAHNGKTNAILLGMLRQECKWLEENRHGRQKLSESTTGTRSHQNGKRSVARKQRRAAREHEAERGQHIRPNGADHVWTQT